MATTTSILGVIQHYQRSIEQSQDNEARLLHCIGKLYKLPIKVEHLQETGIGKTVNALRNFNGEVGVAAKAVVTKWKAMVAAEEEPSNCQTVDETNDPNDRKDSSDDDEKKNDDRNGNSSVTQTTNQSSTNRHHEKERREKDGGGGERRRHSSKEKREERHSKHGSNYDQRHHSSKSSSHHSQQQEKTNGISSLEKSSKHPKTDSSHNQTQENREKSEKKSKHRDRGEHRSEERRESEHRGKDKKRHHHNDDDNVENNSNDSDEERRDKITTTNKHVNGDDLMAAPVMELGERKHSSSQHKSNSSKRKRESESNEEQSHTTKVKLEKENERESTRHRSHEKHSSSSSKSKEKHRTIDDEKKSKDEKRKSSTKEKEHESKSSSKSSSSNQKTPPSASSSSSHRAEKNDSNNKRHRNQSDSDDSNQVDDNDDDDEETHAAKSRKTSKSKTTKSDGNTDIDTDGIDSSMGANFADVLGMLNMPTKKSNKKILNTSKSPNTSIGSSSSNTAQPSSHKRASSSSSTSAQAKDNLKDNQAAMPRINNNVKSSMSSSTASSSSKDASISSSKYRSLPDKKPDLLSSSAKLEPLDPGLLLELPTISTNYKPLPLNQTVMECVFNNYNTPCQVPRAPVRTLTDAEALSHGISSKTMRTKIYSGVKTGQINQVPPLFDLCIRVLQKNIDALEYTGGVPFEVLRPVLERATPQQLLVFEDYNPYLMEDSDVLWQLHVSRNYRVKKRLEMESWREMFLRCQEEEERKLNTLAESIKQSQKIIAAPVRKTQMAFVDSMVKPPRNVMRKQEQYGTKSKLIATPAARVAALSSVTPNAAKTGDVRLRVASNIRDHAQVSSSSARSKKAPLMAKTLQFMKRKR